MKDINWWKDFGVTIICLIGMIILTSLLISAGTVEAKTAATSALWYLYVFVFSIYSSIKTKSWKEILFGIVFILGISFFPLFIISISISTIYTAWTLIKIERYKFYGKSPLVKL